MIGRKWPAGAACILSSASMMRRVFSRRCVVAHEPLNNRYVALAPISCGARTFASSSLSRVGSWYYRQLMAGTFTAALVTIVMRLVPQARRVDIARAFMKFRSTSNTDTESFDSSFLELLPVEERKEIVLLAAVRSPSAARIREIGDLDPKQAVLLLESCQTVELPVDVLVTLVSAAASGENDHAARAIDRSLEMIEKPHLVLPEIAKALKLRRRHVDGAALVSALTGMGQATDCLLEDIYIKGCVVLGEYSTAFRFCGDRVELQKMCLSSLLDNGSTREACEFLSTLNCPDLVLESVHAARLVEQLGRRFLEAGDPEFFRKQIYWIMDLLMKVQNQREIDVSVASAIGSCGQWEVCLQHFDKCSTLLEVERLLTSAARGGAPFESVRPFVITVSRSNPSATRNALREILIRCAAEAGETDEAMRLFEIAKKEGSSDALLDHPNLVGKPGCEAVQFSAMSLLRTGRWREAKERIATPEEREAWENFIVEKEIASEIHSLSVGAAIRLLVRMCNESQWRKVLNEYFPSVPLARATRQWIGHFIAKRLAMEVNEEVAHDFLKSHSLLSDTEANMLLHIVAPSTETLSRIVRSSWGSGMMCFRNCPSHIMPLAADAVEIVRGWCIDSARTPRVFARVEISSRSGRRKSNSIFLLQIQIFGEIDQHVSEVPIDLPDLFATTKRDEARQAVLFDSCRQYGTLPAAEVVRQWARLLTHHHISSEVVGVWIEACVAADNVVTALEVVRLAGVAQITPPLRSLLSLIDILDFSTSAGRMAIAYFHQFPSSHSLLGAVGRALMRRLSVCETDLVPILEALCTSVPDNSSSSPDCELARLLRVGLTPSVLPCVPIEVLASVCRSYDKKVGGAIQRSGFVSCELHVFDNSSFLITGGRPKLPLVEGLASAKLSISLVYKRCDFRLWRVVSDSLFVLCGSQSSAAGFYSLIHKGLIVLTLSDVSPSDMLSVLSRCEAALGSNVTVPLILRVLLCCFFAHHGMTSEATRHLSDLANTEELPMVEIARVMSMIPNPSLRALAWVRLDSIALRCVFGPDRFQPGAKLRSMLERSTLRHEVAYRWLLRPANALLDVGDVASHAEDARRAVDKFEIVDKKKRRVRFGGRNGVH